jgi:hypothetical protein
LSLPVVQPSAPSVGAYTPPLRLTGTVVSQFFRFRCDRQLRYDLVPERDRGGDVPRTNLDPSAGPVVGSRPGMGLLTQAGRRWERKKLRELERRFGPDAILGRGYDELGNPNRLPYEDVVDALRQPGGWKFLVQPELRVPDAARFAERYGFDAARIDLAPAQPDLIRIRRTRSGRISLGVIDIKWSREGSLPHFAQVAFYTLLLEEICRQEEIDVRVDARSGWIWSRGSRGPKRFELAAYRHHVREFLRTDLPRVSGCAPADCAWHLTAQSSGCRYFHHCRAEAEAADDLARIPGLTPLAKQVLRGRKIRSVKELATAGTFRKDVYTGCHALEANEPALKQRAQALRFGKVFDVEGRTQLMGAGEGTRILLSAEGDPVTGLCFALGVRVETNGGRAKDAADVFLARAGTPAGEREMLRGFLERVGDVVGQVERVAAEAPATGGRAGRGRGPSAASVHFFVWDRAELELLRGLLERHIGNPEVQPHIARFAGLLFPAGETGAGSAAPPPGTVLLDAVAELFALPVPYAYHLPAVSDVLRPAEHPHVHAPADDFAWPLSSQVAFERIHNVWKSRPHRRRGGVVASPGEVAEEIRSAVRSKLAAVDSVLRAVRERSAKRKDGRLGMEGGAIPSAKGGEPIPQATLETLRIFTQMESAAEAMFIRALHALPARDRARRFECIRGMEIFERREDGTLVFEFDPDCREAKFRPGDFALVLTNEDTDGLLETDRFPWKRRRLMMDLVEYDLAASPPRVVLSPSGDFKKAVADGEIFLDRVCVLDRAPTDFNTRRIISTLRHLAAGTGEARFVVDLLEGGYPDGWSETLDDGGGRELLARASTAYGREVLNAEQQSAWENVFRQTLSVIWGPPGTGKTYLLAWILLGLAASARREGRPCRILVSAATHRAIVNVLSRVARELEASGIASPLRAVKLAGSGSEADRDLDGTLVEVVKDTALPRMLAESDAAGSPIVVGSTVWSLWKQMKAANGAADADEETAGDVPVRPWFDVVVIDEASQMKVGDALIALSSARRGGRVILCGDDRQLAPVIRGSYREAGGTLFGSVFAHFAGLYGRTSLRESRRMNRTLVEYPRQLFYPGLVSMEPEHRIRTTSGTSTDGVASTESRLAVDAGKSGEPGDAELFEMFFRPDDAVVFATYDGYRAGARNAFEARLVARIARIARERLVDEATGDAFTAARFASHGLAVISPHRAQNSAILAELLAAGFPRGELPVVDTVERMQGNEREMIIVSYAVADGEFAEREAEFLLNPNRFNVSITRPRAKLVLVVSDDVLRTLPRDEQVMTDSMAIKGYPAHCRDELRTVEMHGPDGEPVTLRLRYRKLNASAASSAPVAS